jgi:hypothetical protein
MTTDPEITAALIGGVATVVAVVIGWWLQKSHVRTLAEPNRGESEPKATLASKNSIINGDVNAKNSQLSERPTANISSITVKEIIESINSAPPFQKEQISKQYNGITVKWIGYLKEAMEDPRDKESVYASLTINKETYIGESFWLSEKLANFPEIRILKRGSAVSVTGEILSASGPGLCVTLKPIAIEVLGGHD